jgi:tetratricopeptide (TPR) repeat protein
LVGGRGHHDAAEGAFKTAVELDGRSAAPHLALADFYWSRQRLPEAEGSLKRALQAEPEHVLAHRTMASFLLEVGRAVEAEPHLKRVVDITKAPEAVLAFADFYVSRNDIASARSMLQRLLATGGAEAAANVRLAILDHAEGKKDEGYTRLAQVLAAERTNLQALVSKAGILLTDGRKDEALAAAQLAVKSHPDAAPAQIALARAEQARNELDRAIAAYGEALRLDPRATSAHVARAQLQLKLVARPLAEHNRSGSRALEIAVAELALAAGLLW